MIKQLLTSKLLVGIFFIALFFQLYKLHEIPYGFHADEVRVGWNAYSILKTGRDDWGNNFPFYYNTFGDYRPTGIIYITIPSILIFGLTEFSVRFPSALIGALAVFPVATFVYLTTDKKSVSYASSFFLSISPWWISTARSTNEVTISVFFTLCALTFVLIALRTAQYRYFLYALGCILTSYLFYHSVRLVAPILFLTTVLFFFKKELFHKKKPVILFLLSVFLLSVIFLSDKSAQKRFHQVSFFTANTNTVLSASTTHTPPILLQKPLFLYLKEFINQYSTYFSVPFLVGDTAKPLRYKTPTVGVLTYAEVIFLLAGVVVAVQKKRYRPLLFLLVLTPLAAALTNEDAPNLNRSLLMLPFIAVIMAVGMNKLFHKFPAVTVVLSFFLVVSHIYFWDSYMRHSHPLVGFWRNATMKELISVIENERGSYEKIVLTNDPDSPYPWYAFYTDQKPAEFNQFAIKRSQGAWMYGNISFTQNECPSGDIFSGKDQPPLQNNILVIDGFKCPVESKIADGMQAKVIKQIFNTDGTVAYTLWVKK